MHAASFNFTERKYHIICSILTLPNTIHRERHFCFSKGSFNNYTTFEKRYGDRSGIEDVIVSKRKFQYEEVSVI